MSARSKRRFYFEWVMVFFAAFACAAWLAKAPLGERIDNGLLDQLVALTRNQPDDRILLVAVDETALARVGSWPWRRDILAKLADQLVDGGAKAVGFDILFAEPGDPAADAKLADAMARAGNIVVPAYVNAPGIDGRDSDLVLPTAQIASAARAIGHVNVRFDSDALVRTVHLRLHGGGDVIDHFSLNLARIGDPKAMAAVQVPAARHFSDSSSTIIPYHAAGSYRSISAGALLAGELPAELIRDKIVLVGATAQGLGDNFAVPGAAGHVMSGIEIQANLIDALVHGRMIRAADGGMPVLAIAAFVALLLLAYWYLPPTRGLAASLLALLAAMAAVLSAFLLWRLWYPPSGLMLAALIVYPLWSWRRLAALDAYIQTEAAALSDSLNTGDSRLGRRGMDRISASIANLRALVGRVQYVRAFMERTIEKAPDSLIVVDRQGRILLANPQAYQVLGQSATGANLADLLPSGTTDWSRIDTEIALPSGRILLARGAPLDSASDSPDDRVPAAIVRLIDISQMRGLEAQRNEMLEFLSHDMRAPQAAILTMVGAAAAGGDPLLFRIRRQAEAGLKLADDFVQLARLDSADPKFELVDLGDVIDEAIDRSFAAAHARGVKLQRPGDDQPALIEADPWLLDRAFGNLLGNAIKFSPSGGVVRCGIALLDGGTHYCATIADSGPGLSAERLAAPFERFGSRATDGGGAGLGLAFVKKTIDAHGAAIAVTSDVNGTCFTMTFAAAPNPEVESAGA